MRKITFGEAVVKKTMRMHLNVRPEHIGDGECRIPSQCMIAVAISEMISNQPNFNNIAPRCKIETRGASITYQGRRWRADLPAKARRALIAFDEGRHVNPFDCVLEFRDSGPTQKLTQEQKNTYTETRRNREEARAKADRKRGVKSLDAKPKSKFHMRQRIIGLAEPAPARGKGQKYREEARP